MKDMTGTISISSLSRIELLLSYGISGEELEIIQAAGKKLLPKLDEHIEQFYEWIETLPEHRIFFSDPERLKRVKKLQRDYWTDFYAGRVDDEYVRKRRQVGETHARIGLSLATYFAAMNAFLGFFQAAIDTRDSRAQRQDTIWALTKLAHLDTGLVVEAFTAITAKTVASQSSALLEMSTPVTVLWDEILMLPIVGLIDSKRSQDIMDAMLSKVAEARAKVIVLDISGVAVVDTAVANHLIKITKATRLMGCECVISGLSPAIARTIVELGIDVEGVKTTSTLQDALSYAFRATGVELKQTCAPRMSSGGEHADSH